MKRATTLFTFFCISISAICQQKKNGLTISLPYVNNYQFYHYEKTKDSSLSGFVGFSLGYFSMIGKNRLSLNVGLTADLLAPIGPIDIKYEGEQVWMRGKYAELLFHHRLFNKFHTVYGINFLTLTYRFANFDTGLDYQKNDRSIGLTAGAEYQFTRNFSVAALYKPGLLSFDHNSYKHLISLDFRFDINFRKNSPLPRE